MLASIVSAVDLNVYDAQGNLLGQTSRQDVSRWMQNGKSQKKIYMAAKSVVSKKQSYKTKSPRKTMGKKRWYEVDWNQGIKICPEKKFNKEDGVWIVNGAARVDSLNCVYIEGSPYTRSILALYSRNLNDLSEADSSWILVNQAIVELSGKTFNVRKGFNKECKGKGCDIYTTENMTFEHDLIVDKTEMRIRDAMWLQESSSSLRKMRNVVADYDYKKNLNWFNKEFYPSVSDQEMLDYPIPYNHMLVMLRSIKDGLDISWVGELPQDSARANGYVLQKLEASENVSTWNLSSNGYRVPTVNEWIVLMSGGTSTVFAWGDTLDKKALSREMNVECSDKAPGLYPVRKYVPNAFDLYDVYGNAEESVIGLYKDNEDSSVTRYAISSFCGTYDGNNMLPVCRAMRPYACAKKNNPRENKEYSTFYIGFTGVRAVRILE